MEKRGRSVVFNFRVEVGSEVVRFTSSSERLNKSLIGRQNSERIWGEDEKLYIEKLIDLSVDVEEIKPEKEKGRQIRGSSISGFFVRKFTKKVHQQ